VCGELVEEEIVLSQRRDVLIYMSIVVLEPVLVL